MPNSIYLDNQATTPTDPRVRDALLQFLETGSVGNPHSEHVVGRRASAAVEEAREKVASLIGAQPHEIIFTSGATEANNLALQGLARSPHRRGNHIITCAAEHKCVLETVGYLARNGFHADVLPVDSRGFVDTAVLAAAITPHTFLVSIMAANNEIGVLQPIEEIAAICRTQGVVFHTDAAQAAGKISIDVKANGVDAMSLSGHKILRSDRRGGLVYFRRKLDRAGTAVFGRRSRARLAIGQRLLLHLCAAFGGGKRNRHRRTPRMNAQAAAALRGLFLGIVSARCPNVRVEWRSEPTSSRQSRPDISGVRRRPPRRRLAARYRAVARMPHAAPVYCSPPTCCWPWD